MLISRPRPLTTTDLPGAASAGIVTAGAGRVDAPLGGLDAETLARLALLDPSGESRLLERVLKAYQASAARLVPQLVAAQLSGDRNAIRLVAHTLKSSSASIGALALSQRCAQIEAATAEAAARDASPATLDADIAALRQALASTLQVIERLLADAPA